MNIHNFLCRIKQGLYLVNYFLVILTCQRPSRTMASKSRSAGKSTGAMGAYLQSILPSGVMMTLSPCSDGLRTAVELGPGFGLASGTATEGVAGGVKMEVNSCLNTSGVKPLCWAGGLRSLEWLMRLCAFWLLLKRHLFFPDWESWL
jgi:hypothetical protein